MPASARRRSRIAAFQVLFEADVSGRPALDVFQRHEETEQLAADARAFTQHLVAGVAEHRAAIDAIIQERAPAFPLADMSAVDRNVLRLAIFEVLFDNRGAPLRVAINEAVELAKGYGSESSGRFVNGVLGAVVMAAAGSDEHGDDGGD